MTANLGYQVIIEPGRSSGATVMHPGGAPYCGREGPLAGAPIVTAVLREPPTPRARGDRATPTALAPRDRFAAYVAHELRGPITLQRTLVEVALADPDADTNTLREMGQRVMSALGHQQRLIEGLLDLTRTQSQLRSHEPVDLAAVAKEALRTHDPRKLASIVLLKAAWTTGDASLLTQLADNLVSNATRHNIPQGLITLTTGTARSRVFLSVTNTGPSIPPRELERLFQPFHRLAPQRRERAPGLGLGLAIVQAIADAHHALITVRARAGGGLAMHVSFPKSPPPTGPRSG
jgi:signal transduction histidine kinase